LDGHWRADAGFAQSWQCLVVSLQRFNASGVKVGGEVHINATTVGPQDFPQTFGVPDGVYLAVWEGSGPGDDYGIFTQRFNSAGAKVGVETLVNTASVDIQSEHMVAVQANGNYLIIWESYSDTVTGPDQKDVFSQLYNSVTWGDNGPGDVSGVAPMPTRLRSSRFPWSVLRHSSAQTSLPDRASLGLYTCVPGKISPGAQGS